MLISKQYSFVAKTKHSICSHSQSSISNGLYRIVSVEDQFVRNVWLKPRLHAVPTIKNIEHTVDESFYVKHRRQFSRYLNYTAYGIHDLI